MSEYDSKGPFCQCTYPSSIHTEIGEFGQWSVCDDCKEPIENSFEYFNHYDGEDHTFEY